MSKCKKNKPCKGAIELHFNGYPDRQGLSVVDTFNIDTRLKGKRIGYRKTGVGHIYLNFCPWCGVDQNFPTKKAS